MKGGEFFLPYLIEFFEGKISEEARMGVWGGGEKALGKEYSHKI